MKPREPEWDSNRMVGTCVRSSRTHVGPRLIPPYGAPDASRTQFGIALCRALARGADIERAYDAAVAAVLTMTALSLREQCWAPKFELVDPVEAGADLSTGQLPSGRVAAGLPWLIRPLPSHALRGVPERPSGCARRSHEERALISAILAHRSRSTSDAPDAATAEAATTTEVTATTDVVATTDAAAATPRPSGPSVIVLVGGPGHGKTTLAAWLAHDLRAQSVCADGVVWLDGGVGMTDWPPACGRRSLIVLDGVQAPLQPLEGFPEQFVLVTTRLPAVASALKAGSAHVSVLRIPPLPPIESLTSDVGAETTTQSLEQVLRAPPAADSESLTWVLLLQLALTTIPTYAMLAKSQERGGGYEKQVVDEYWWPVILTPAPFGLMSERRIQTLALQVELAFSLHSACIQRNLSNDPHDWISCWQSHCPPLTNPSCVPSSRWAGGSGFL